MTRHELPWYLLVLHYASQITAIDQFLTDVEMWQNDLHIFTFLTMNKSTLTAALHQFSAAKNHKTYRIKYTILIPTTATSKRTKSSTNLTNWPCNYNQQQAFFPNQDDAASSHWKQNSTEAHAFDSTIPTFCIIHKRLLCHCIKQPQYLIQNSR